MGDIFEPSTDYQYFLWMQQNPFGLVGNILTRRNDKVRIHKSGCNHINGYTSTQEVGSFTSHHVKLCSNSLNELVDELGQRTSKPVEYCNDCMPQESNLEKDVGWCGAIKVIEESLERCIATPEHHDNDDVLGSDNPGIYSVRNRARIRDQRIVQRRLEIANGNCESCGNPGPFVPRGSDRLFLEVHHILPLSENGPDRLENTIALCPNCHRREHLGEQKHFYDS